MSRKIAIIGGGASGCFCAVQLKRMSPQSDVSIFEAQHKLMSKLALTGGGRCNISNTFEDVKSLQDAYPRGERLVREAFRVFSPQQTCKWWESVGVRLIEEDYGRLFPRSGDAMQVVRTLEKMLKAGGVHIGCSKKVENIKYSPETSNYTLYFKDLSSRTFDVVVLTSGGGAFSMLGDLGDIKIEKTVPSLFSLRIADERWCGLSGTVIKNATVGLAATKFRAQGDVLITDWGVSGPAILKLSSFAAYHLNEFGYKGQLILNYLSLNEVDTRKVLEKLSSLNQQKFIVNTPPEGLSSRLWGYLLFKSSIRTNQRWAELGSKGMNRLIGTLVSDTLPVGGKCRFRDEFVTAGGVSRREVKSETLESRQYPGLYFAGEVLDIDAVTGGFNLQAAWSTAYLVAQSIARDENA